jgi:hypothetical protein
MLVKLCHCSLPLLGLLQGADMKHPKLRQWSYYKASDMKHPSMMLVKLRHWVASHLLGLPQGADMKHSFSDVGEAPPLSSLPFTGTTARCRHEECWWSSCHWVASHLLGLPQGADMKHPNVLIFMRDGSTYPVQKNKRDVIMLHERSQPLYPMQLKLLSLISYVSLISNMYCIVCPWPCMFLTLISNMRGVLYLVRLLICVCTPPHTSAHSWQKNSNVVYSWQSTFLAKE